MNKHLNRNSEAVRFYLWFSATFAIWWAYLFAIISMGELVGKLVDSSAIEVAVDVVIFILTYPYVVTLVNKISNWVVR